MNQRSNHLSNLPSHDDIEAVDVQATTIFLANEIRQLSPQEQYNIYQDVNGTNVLASTEPFELSSIGLKALDKQLETVHDSRYTYYRLAEKMGSTMIKDTEFRLKFARAERFDPLKTAARIENYLKLLSENFGDRSLNRTIKLADLNKVCDCVPIIKMANEQHLVMILMICPRRLCHYRRGKHISHPMLVFFRFS